VAGGAGGGAGGQVGGGVSGGGEGGGVRAGSGKRLKGAPHGVPFFLGQW
jgi:hypothetical protein